MTLEEFKTGNYVISVSCYENFVNCMKIMENLGFTWRNGKKFSEEVLTRGPIPGYSYYGVWKNEEGIIRFSDRRNSYYAVTDGNKLTKKLWSVISDSNPTVICSSDLVSTLGLDVDEEGFEKETM